MNTLGERTTYVAFYSVSPYWVMCQWQKKLKFSCYFTQNHFQGRIRDTNPFGNRNFVSSSENSILAYITRLIRITQFGRCVRMAENRQHQLITGPWMHFPFNFFFHCSSTDIYNVNYEKMHAPIWWFSKFRLLPIVSISPFIHVSIYFKHFICCVVLHWMHVPVPVILCFITDKILHLTLTNNMPVWCRCYWWTKQQKKKICVTIYLQFQQWYCVRINNRCGRKRKKKNSKSSKIENDKVKVR